MGVKFPQQSVIYLAVCLSGVMIFLLLGIVPSQGTLSSLGKKIEAAERRIEEQGKLVPLYQSLQQHGKKGDGFLLPVPQKDVLPQGGMEELIGTVRGLAAKERVDVLSISPVMNTLGRESKFLELNVEGRGDFFSFRKFITGLGGIAYLEQIDEIQIEQSQRGLLIRLKLWFVRRR